MAFLPPFRDCGELSGPGKGGGGGVDGRLAEFRQILEWEAAQFVERVMMHAAGHLGSQAAEADRTAALLAGIQSSLEVVANRDGELRRENEELRRLLAGGYLDFARKVRPRDFCRFVFILVYGDRAKAARELGEKPRRFYEEIE